MHMKEIGNQVHLLVTTVGLIRAVKARESPTKAAYQHGDGNEEIRRNASRSTGMRNHLTHLALLNRL